LKLAEARKLLSEVDDTIKSASRGVFDIFRNEEETEEDKKKKRSQVNKWFNTVDWRNEQINRASEEK
jgi:hypothetical protein